MIKRLASDGEDEAISHKRRAGDPRVAEMRKRGAAKEKERRRRDPSCEGDLDTERVINTADRS